VEGARGGRSAFKRSKGSFQGSFQRSFKDARAKKKKAHTELYESVTSGAWLSAPPALRPTHASADRTLIQKFEKI